MSNSCKAVTLRAQLFTTSGSALTRNMWCIGGRGGFQPRGRGRGGFGGRGGGYSDYGYGGYDEGYGADYGYGNEGYGGEGYGGYGGGGYDEGYGSAAGFGAMGATGAMPAMVPMMLPNGQVILH